MAVAAGCWRLLLPYGVAALPPLLAASAALACCGFCSFCGFCCCFCFCSCCCCLKRSAVGCRLSALLLCLLQPLWLRATGYGLRVVMGGIFKACFFLAFIGLNHAKLLGTVFFGLFLFHFPSKFSNFRRNSPFSFFFQLNSANFPEIFRFSFPFLFKSANFRRNFIFWFSLI